MCISKNHEGSTCNAEFLYFNFKLLLLNVFQVMLFFHGLFTVLVRAHHLFLLLAIWALAECLVGFLICDFVVVVVLNVFICDLLNVLSMPMLCRVKLCDDK